MAIEKAGNCTGEAEAAVAAEGASAEGAASEEEQDLDEQGQWQIKFGLDVVVPTINSCFSGLVKHFVAKRLGDAIGFIYDTLFQVGDDLAKLHVWAASHIR